MRRGSLAGAGSRSGPDRAGYGGSAAVQTARRDCHAAHQGCLAPRRPARAGAGHARWRAGPPGSPRAGCPAPARCCGQPLLPPPSASSCCMMLPGAYSAHTDAVPQPAVRSLIGSCSLDTLAPAHVTCQKKPCPYSTHSFINGSRRYGYCSVRPTEQVIAHLSWRDSRWRALPAGSLIAWSGQACPGGRIPGCPESESAASNR